MATGGDARVPRVEGPVPAIGRALPLGRAGSRYAEAFGRLRAALAARPWLLALVGLALLWLTAFALRVLFLGRSFDIFIDEVTYLILSKNVANGEGVTLSGKPFFLHPPLFFLIEGPFQAALGQARLVLDEVERVRILNALLAATTAVVLYAIVARTAGRRLGLVAFAFFAIDAFVIRMNSRNLLETSALLWVTLGYLSFLIGIRDPHTRMPLRYTASVGLFFGMALLTKEMTAFLTLLPLGIAWLTGWFAPRLSVFTAGLVTVTTYSLYPLVIALDGLAPTFLAQKLDGLLRFLGIMKTTGFVHGTGPSFVEAIVRNLDAFATTYMLLGLGIPACLILLASHDRPRRLLGVFGASAYALLAYSVTLGTLEEQFFYFLVVPAFLSVPVAWASVLGGDPDPSPVVRRFVGRVPAPRLAAIRRLGGAAMAISVGWSAMVWTAVHLTPDNGYEQLLSYMHREIPFGTPIGVTSEPAEFLMQGYVIEKLPTPTALANSDADYVIVSAKQIDDEYLEGGRALYAWLAAHGRREFAFTGRTYGRLELYSLRGQHTLLEATFDDAPTGGPLPDPWTIGGFGAVDIAAFPTSVDRSARIGGAGPASGATACHPVTVPGVPDLDMSLDFRASKGVGQGDLFALVSAGAEVAKVGLDRAGRVTATGNGTPSTPLATETWYRLTMAIDPVEGTFDWQVAPSEPTAGAAIRGTGTLNLLDTPVDSICIAWRPSSTESTLWVDDLVIRD